MRFPRASLQHLLAAAGGVALLLLLLACSSSAQDDQAQQPIIEQPDATGTSPTAGSSVQTYQVSIPAFTALRTCLPFNLLLLPPTGAGAGNVTAPANVSEPTEGVLGTPDQTAGGGAAPGTAAENVTAGGAAAGNATTDGAAAENVTTGGAAGNATMGGAAAGNATTSGAPAGNATLYFTADPAVANVTDVFVTEQGVLSFSIKDGFQTPNAINATLVAADASSLQYLQNFGSGSLVVAPGFNLTNLTVDATGLGSVFAYGLSVGELLVSDTGTSPVLLNGTFGAVQVVASGTASVYLAGNVSGPVSVRADGISTVWIQGSQGTVINGTADALSKVLYTAGTCNVRPRLQLLFGLTSIFGSPCQQVSAEASGPEVGSPQWTCGLYVDGSSNCRGIGSYLNPSNQGTTIPLNSSTPAAPAAPGTTGGTASAAGITLPPIGAGLGGGTTTTTGAPGQVTTGTFTTPGGFSSATGSVSGGGGGFTQTQTSQGGSPAQTTISGLGAATSANTPSGIARGLGIPSSASGITVISTPCEQQGPLDMLLQLAGGGGA